MAVESVFSVFGSLLVFLPLIIIGILFTVFWIIMLVDAATRKFKSDSDKVVWILVIVLVGIIGALIYYFVVYVKEGGKSMKWFWITLLVLAILFVLFIILIAIILFYGGIMRPL